MPTGDAGASSQISLTGRSDVGLGLMDLGCNVFRVGLFVLLLKTKDLK